MMQEQPVEQGMENRENGQPEKQRPSKDLAQDYVTP